MATEKFPACTAYIQYCTTNSQAIMTQYYEIELKYGKQEVSRANEVLDFIRDGIVAPFNFVGDNYIARKLDPDEKSGIVTWDDILIECINKKTNKVSSMYDACIEQKQEELDALIETFSMLD